MNRKEAIELAEKVDEKVSAYDTVHRWVIVRGINDLTCAVFDQAFLIHHDDHYFVFPEHHEFQIFHDSEFDAIMLFSALAENITDDLTVDEFLYRE